MKQVLPAPRISRITTFFALAAAVLAAAVSASVASASEGLEPALPDASVLSETLRANAVAEAEGRMTRSKTSRPVSSSKPNSAEVERSFAGYFYGSHYLPCTRILSPPDAEIQSCGIAGRYTDGVRVWAFLVTTYQLCSYAQRLAGYSSGCGPAYSKTVDWWILHNGYWWPTTSPV